ncbi:MAG: hypothetical protein Q7W45_04905 [Bacteroidota bacterium]|nr:hypothetical protein [Bacteroidota bacterium]MDP3144785.1 hypothetical protein [Bacteroidota bacterium]MDP3557843.1 hypothetical protein [Bacteroidota bacterium]
MEELDVNNYLIQENLFELFKRQLKKDFDSCSLSTDFVENLAIDWELLKKSILNELNPLIKNNSLLSNLLYRIDISELQIKNYQLKNTTLSFEEILAELIIKRILQKVILKKRFSQ